MVTQETLQALARCHTDGTPVVSFYLNVDGRYRTPLQLAEITRQLVRRLDSDLLNREWSSEARRSISDDQDRLTKFIGAEFDRGNNRGLAIFASSASNTWHVFATNSALPDSIGLSEQPVLRPLARLLAENAPAYIVLLDREKARILAIDDGKAVQLMLIEDDVPRRVHTGSHYGLSDKKIESHVDDHIDSHLRHVAEEVCNLLRQSKSARLTVGGQKDTVTRFLEFIPGELTETEPSILNGLTVTSSQSEIEDHYLQSVAQTRPSEAADLIASMHEGLRVSGRAVTGIDDSLYALFQGSVGTLVLNESLNAPGFRCPACRRLMSCPGTCAECGSNTLPVTDVVEAAVCDALAMDAQVLPIHNGDTQPEWDGIGALLRFPIAVVNTAAPVSASQSVSMV